MGRARAPRRALAAALAEVARGATHTDAAARHGLGTRTLRRAIAEAKPKPKPKAKQRPKGRDRRRAPDEDEDKGLLDTLVAELRDARRERRDPRNSDAENRAWAKAIRELVSAIERIAPAPGPPPDMVQAELRRLDGITIGLIEQFFADALKPEDLA